MLVRQYERIDLDHHASDRGRVAESCRLAQFAQTFQRSLDVPTRGDASLAMKLADIDCLNQVRAPDLGLIATHDLDGSAQDQSLRLKPGSRRLEDGQLGTLGDPHTQIGVLARSVADVALLLDPIAGPNGHHRRVGPAPRGDPSSRPREPSSHAVSRNGSSVRRRGHRRQARRQPGAIARKRSHGECGRPRRIRKCARPAG